MVDRTDETSLDEEEKEETQSDDSQALRHFQDCWTIESLLQVDSLDNEAHITQVLQDCYLLCYAKEARHMFCQHLPFFTTRGRETTLKLHDFLVYRFLYGFVYETQTDVHDFVSSEILGTCQKCVVGYHAARRLFLHIMASVYDTSSVVNLDDEYFKWEVERMMSGLRCGAASSGDTGVSVVSKNDPPTQHNQFFNHHQVNSDPPQTSKVATSLLEVLLRGERFQSTETSKKDYADLWQLLPKAVSRHAGYKEMAQTVLESPRFLFTQVISQCIHSAKEFRTLSWALVEQLTLMLNGPNSSPISSEDCPKLAKTINKVFRRWQSNVLCVVNKCENSHHTSLPSASLTSRDINTSTPLSFSVHMPCTCLSNSANVLSAAVGLTDLTESLASHSAVGGEGTTIPLKRIALELIVHACRSSPTAAITYFPACSHCLDLIQGISLAELDPNLLGSGLAVLKGFLDVASLRCATLCCLEGLMRNLCQGFLENPRDVSDQTLSWRLPLQALWTSLHLSAFHEQLQSQLDTSVNITSDPDFTEFRVLLWTLALDAHLCTPSFRPIWQCPDDSETSRQGLFGSMKPLLLENEQVVISLVVKSWQLRGHATAVHETPDTRIHGEKKCALGRSPPFVLTAVGALLNWALVDFQYEVNVLQGCILSPTSTHLIDVERFPRSQSWLDVVFLFVTHHLSTTPTAADFVTEFVLRHLSDLSILLEAFQSRAVLIKSVLGQVWTKVFQYLDKFQTLAETVLENVVERLKAAETFESPLPVCTPPQAKPCHRPAEELLAQLRSCAPSFGPNPAMVLNNVASFKWRILEQFLKHLLVLLSGCFSHMVMNFVHALVMYIFSSSYVPVTHPPDHFHAILKSPRRGVLLVLAHSLSQEPEVSHLLFSLQLASESVLHRIHSLHSALTTLYGSPPGGLTTQNTYTLPWFGWLSVVKFLLPSLEAKYKAVLAQRCPSHLLTPLEKFFDTSWKIVRTLLENMLHMKQHSSLADSLVSRSFDHDRSSYDIVTRDDMILSVLLFLNSWVASALQLVEGLVQSALCSTASLHGTPWVHVEAFRQHTPWTLPCVRWCMDLQESQALLFFSHPPVGEKGNFASSSDVALVWQAFRNTAVQKAIESLSTLIAKGMSFVHRHFKEKPVEKGSFYIPLLARGDLSPNLAKKLVESSSSALQLRNGLSQDSGPNQNSHKDSSHELDVLNEATRPSSSTKAKEVSPEKKLVNPWSFLAQTPFSKPAKPSGLKNTSSFLGGHSLKTAPDTLTPRAFTSLKSRFSKPLFFKPKKTGRIAESLLRKLGDTKLLTARPALQRHRLVSLSQRKPLADHLAKNLKTPSTIRQPKALVLPMSTSTTLGCTVLASNAPLPGKYGDDALRNDAEQKKQKDSLKQSFHHRLSPSEKSSALEKASSQLHEILNVILEWDIFNLERLEIPHLGQQSKVLPLCFTSVEEFEQAFRPLVLEECRASLIQSGTEKRLESIPLQITRSTRLGKNTLIVTVRKDSAACPTDPSSQSMNSSACAGGWFESSGVPSLDKRTDSLPWQPWSLVLLVPSGDSSTANSLDKRTFSDIRSPPLQGYCLGIVERDDDQDLRLSEAEHMLCAKLRMPFRQSSSVSQQLRRIPSTRVTINSKWMGYSLGSLTTFIREVQSLYVSHLSPLFPFLLNPQRFLNEKKKALCSSQEQMEKNTHEQPPNASRQEDGSFQGEAEDSVHFAQHVWPNGPTLEEVQKRCHLNPFQAVALFHGVTSAHHVALLQGPPGTGKTHTIWALLAVLYGKKEQRRATDPHSSSTCSGGSGAYGKKKILVCAPSNAAIDEIAFRVLQQGFPLFGSPDATIFPKCIRLGNPQRITRPEVLSICLCERVKKETPKIEQSKKAEYHQQKLDATSELDAIAHELDDVDSLREAECFQAVFQDEQSAEQIRFQAQTKKIHLVEKKKRIQSQMHRLKQNLKSELKETKKTCQDTALQEADVLFCTLSGAASECLNGLTIDYAIVDEAAQAVELSTLIPLRWELLGLILIGDPQQLPATVLSRTAKQLAYERSLFQRLQQCGVETKMLRLQYRMHPKISEFPSLYFYNKNISNAPTVLQRQDLPCYSWKYLFEPFLFFHVPSKETRCAVSQSLSNHEEALFIVSLVRSFHKQFHLNSTSETTQKKSYDATTEGSPPRQDKVSWNDLSIVTPYKQQVAYLRSLFSSHFQDFPPNVPEICTIDAFQGREKRIIIFSCVRATPLPSFTSTSVSSGSASLALSTPLATRSALSHQRPLDHETSSCSLSTTLGFVADVRRMNVAITRARDCLWIVGNAHTLSTNPAWDALIRYSQQSMSYCRSAEACFVDIVSVTQRLSSQLRTSSHGLSEHQPLSATMSLFFRVAEQYNSPSPASHDPGRPFSYDVGKGETLAQHLSAQRLSKEVKKERNTKPHLREVQEEDSWAMSSCSSLSSSESPNVSLKTHSQAAAYSCGTSVDSSRPPSTQVNPKKGPPQDFSTPDEGYEPMKPFPLIARKSKSPALCPTTPTAQDTTSSLMISTKKQKSNGVALRVDVALKTPGLPLPFPHRPFHPTLPKLLSVPPRPQSVPNTRVPQGLPFTTLDPSHPRLSSKSPLCYGSQLNTPHGSYAKTRPISRELYQTTVPSVRHPSCLATTVLKEKKGLQ